MFHNIETTGLTREQELATIIEQMGSVGGWSDEAAKRVVTLADEAATKAWDGMIEAIGKADGSTLEGVQTVALAAQFLRDTANGAVKIATEMVIRAAGAKLAAMGDNVLTATPKKEG